MAEPYPTPDDDGRHLARRWFRRALLAIGVAGLLARAAYVLVLTPDLSGGADWRFFRATSAELAAGNGYRLFRPLLVPRMPVATVPTALHPPAYPAALALWSRVAGGSERALRLLGGLTGLVTIVSVALIARELAGPAAGSIAAGLAATSPFSIGVDGALMSETLFSALVALALVATYALRSRPGAARAALLGAIVGVAALTRTEALLLVPLLLLPACAREGGRAGPLLAAALVSCGVVVLGWTLRNWSVFGRPVLVSTNACGVIAGANCPPAYSGRGIGGWDLACLVPPSGNEAADAERWCADGFAFALAHRDALPRVLAARLLRTWNLWPGALSRVGEGQPRRVDRAGKAWLLACLVAGMIGAVVLYRRGELVWPLAAPIAMTSLAGMLGWGLPRLQAGAVPSLVVLASLALAAAPRLLSGGSREAL